MKLGLMLPIGEKSVHRETPRYADVLAMARAAEGAGFDSLWVTDHLIMRFPGQEERGAWEAFTLLAALAGATSQIALAPLVACTSFRNPALLAKMADTLDEISGGRFILGLGAGWHQPEYEAFGYPFDHLASRFEEALRIIVPLLREGHVDFKGTYYEARDCDLRPRGPSPTGPAIWIGAGQPRMLRLTARYADAWNTAWHAEPLDVAERYQDLLAACQKVGRDPATIALTAGSMAHVLAPGEERKPDEGANTGTPEEVAQALAGFAAVGVKHLVLILRPRDVDGIRRFARVIELLDATL
jgi:probable F420-dependent oxidoreductase